MPLSRFHPAVSQWFAQRFREPTPPQQRGWDAIRSGRHTLIAAPTGSGKTLAAFLSALDELLREGLQKPLADEVRIVYVSPLKALSVDIHQNLAEPRREIRQVIEAMGLPPVKITAAVRTGDTPASERASMLRMPPHILVTTPESLYLLLTAERSREMLRTTRTVIVDEIHAVLESRRGAHLAVSLERLEHITAAPLVRIGLSATQKPIEDVARFLVGAANLDEGGDAKCAIVDEGHSRQLDLALELPRSPLEAVMSGEVWTEVYDRLAQLIREHRTTLVFVNTRRLAERVARHLSERLGDEWVMAHHGSLARDVRLDAEARLRGGRLKALVATASLELGIDIGAVDLVCQLGSTRRISTLLQRVGRAEHTVGGTPKGRLFPLSRDDLVECTALLRAVRGGQLDRLDLCGGALDVLAQQIVAEVSCEDWSEAELYTLVGRAYPYRALSRNDFDAVVQMVAHGFATRRGRRGALVHYDAVGSRLRGRRGARLAAITSGGAIPDTADFRVVLEPGGTFVGTLNEDFAIESMAGDVFQLGNVSWRILRVESGVVRVEDARGQPPSIPFWFGEAPGRTAELSAAVSSFRGEVESRLDDRDAANEWLMSELGLAHGAALQIVEYLGETKRLLGVVPTQDRLVAERFFDQAGGMQLVLHAPFGSRINRAWGLALRKRFCRQFNFELQAAATEDALVLSLGPQHSFPLEDVFRYLHPDRVREVLVQALLDAPMFQTRWRWGATISLAILRSRSGKRTAPQIQRMESEDLLAAVFPDAAACLENIAGDREVPDHPLVQQTVEDCLHEAMDLAGLLSVLRRITAGELVCLGRDTPEPSPLSHETLNAKPYAFLDDAPLEERRTQAVYTRRAFEPSSADDLGALDSAAIARVRDEVWPVVEDADELHDALLTSGFLTDEEVKRLEGAAAAGSSEQGDEVDVGEQATVQIAARLVAAKRAGWVGVTEGRIIWFAVERMNQVRSVYPSLSVEPADLPTVPASREVVDRHSAIRELIRGRLEVVGPTTAAELAVTLGVEVKEIDAALLALEGEGVVLRGKFTPSSSEQRPNTCPLEWCDRRLLARIHRYTLNRLRSEIEPVSSADFMRFLFAWQRVDPAHRAAGVEGLAAVVAQLNGFELAASAWEPDVLASRCDEYDPLMLDTLCLTGRVSWGRVSPPLEPGSGPFVSGPLRSTPVALFLRDDEDLWIGDAPATPAPLSSYGGDVLHELETSGASFFHDLVRASGLLPSQVEQALGELVAVGLVTADSFAGLRALLIPSGKRRPRSGARRKHRTSPFGVESAGRWAMLRQSGEQAPHPASESDELPMARSGESARVERYARVLLRRYGVVFRRVLAREGTSPPWRDVLRTLRRLEARGEIRGGRFVAGMAGEQFALPEAVGQLRAIRRAEPTGDLFGISGADPLNLTGIVTPGDRVPALAVNRIVFRDGVPIAAREAGEFRILHSFDPTLRHDVERALVRKRVSPALRAYLGNVG
jgi:ATP-dependent Lhr-like helicase